MRLWHQKLIHHLPNKQLLGQHMELSALRGLGWGRKHSTINYVFSHPYSLLFDYHWIVIKELKERGYKVDTSWEVRHYRGKTLKYQLYIHVLSVPLLQSNGNQTIKNMDV